jgi:hypothetical protein
MHLPVDAASVLKTTMEEYAEFVLDMTVPDYNVVVTPDLNKRVTDKTIRIIADVFSDCPTPHELKESLLKRLKNKKDVVSSVDLCVVTALCLASGDYSVSHVSLCNVTERNMLKVWSNLERQAVSSSYQLRRWIRSRIGTRTCEGYMAYWNISRSFGSSVANKRITPGLWSKSMNVTEDMAYKITGQPTTVLEAIRDDMVISGKLACLLGH